MKKAVQIFLMMIVFGSLLKFTPAMAAGNTWFDQTFSNLGHTAQSAGMGETPMDPRMVVANIVKIILGLVATILFVLNVYAGYLWMTAAGNDEKVTKAKHIIRDATIGLVVALSAYGITIAVTNIALGRSLGSGANRGTTIEDAIQRGNWW